MTIKGFLKTSSCAMNSLNSEKGGLVMTISASLRRLEHSTDLKSPFPIRLLICRVFPSYSRYVPCPLGLKDVAISFLSLKASKFSLK